MGVGITCLAFTALVMQESFSKWKTSMSKYELHNHYPGNYQAAAYLFSNNFTLKSQGKTNLSVHCYPVGSSLAADFTILINYGIWSLILKNQEFDE